MEFYAAVRRSAYVEGLSERAAARRFGLARETVRKMLRYRLPPGYRRAKPIRCPKLDAFTGVIDQILTDDQQRPKKQRHTAKRIWERLCVEHAFTGGYTIIKDYVRRQKLGGQEMFVPLALRLPRSRGQVKAFGSRHGVYINIDSCGRCGSRAQRGIQRTCGRP